MVVISKSNPSFNSRFFLVFEQGWAHPFFWQTPVTFEAYSGQTTASWPACKVSISSSSWVLQLSSLFHPISLSIEEVILIWILPSFRRPPRISRRFPAKPRRVRRRARYQSLRLFKNYNFGFYLTWFRWVTKKLWASKVGWFSGRISDLLLRWTQAFQAISSDQGL